MRGHSLAIANHSTSHLAWQLTGWSPRQYLAAIEFAFSRDKKEDFSAALAVRVLMPCFEREIIFRLNGSSPRRGATSA
jgi:hypothetical protein